MGRKLDVILTGATGITGRYVLYELLRMHKEKLLEGQLIVLTDSNKKPWSNSEKRIQKLLVDKYVPDYIRNFDSNFWMQFIRIVDCDMRDSDPIRAIYTLPKKEFYVIHTPGFGKHRTSMKIKKKMTAEYLKWFLPQVYPERDSDLRNNSDTVI